MGPIPFAVAPILISTLFVPSPGHLVYNHALAQLHLSMVAGGLLSSANGLAINMKNKLQGNLRSIHVVVQSINDSELFLLEGYHAEGEEFGEHLTSKKAPC